MIEVAVGGGLVALGWLAKHFHGGNGNGKSNGHGISSADMKLAIREGFDGLRGDVREELRGLREDVRDLLAIAHIERRRE